MIEKFQHTGERYGRLTILRRSDSYTRAQPKWRCRCDCGNEKDILFTSMRLGKSTSCGCAHKEQLIARGRTHGLSTTRTYHRWWDMVRRCHDPRVSGYEKYGARGIRVCERWRKFENFFADMGHPPRGMSIEREDNDGDYCPENCRWATNAEQARNTRKSHKITFNGETMVLADWAKRLGIRDRTLTGRLRRYGWSIEKALTTPPAPTWDHRVLAASKKRS